MQNRDKIIKQLGNSGSMCDDCLSSYTMIKPRQSINISCRSLEQSNIVTRVKDMCPQCKKIKILNKLHQSTKVRQTNSIILNGHHSHSKDIASNRRYEKGSFPSGEMSKMVALLAQKISCGDIEIYNEFSLQHELGILLRQALPQKSVQFERNISFFGFEKPSFVKREIDIVIYDKSSNKLEAAIELKFPRNGQHPEQMFSFCKDVVFAEQLLESGFSKTYVVIFAEDRLFYEGNQNGIYSYFRGGKNLAGKIIKPTGSKVGELFIKGSYKVNWNNVCGKMKYTIIEVD